MKVEYDKYYQTKNLFGEPYPELIRFFSKLKHKGKLLDLGCGQGRDSIPLAKLGYTVTGIDNSQVGIEQLNKMAQKEKLPLVGITGDIYKFSNFDEFDFILLDSMFHFGKKERKIETAFLNRLITDSKLNTIISICIQKVGTKLKTLNDIISKRGEVEMFFQTELLYKFEDKASKHSSVTKYEMIVLKKIRVAYHDSPTRYNV